MRDEKAERRPGAGSGALGNRAGGGDSTQILAPGTDVAPYCPVHAGAARAGSAAQLAAARLHRHGQPVNQPRWRGWIGCPCGCESRPPYVLDPECKARRPIGPPVGYGTPYDVVTLGLVPHDRARCPHCRAVRA